MPDENKLENIEPETREETFLQDIADGTQTLTPAVRKEEFLRRVSLAMGEGGGSCLVPPPTAEDVGKVLTAEAETEIDVIVPEQTVTTDGSSPAPLAGVTEVPEAGETLTATINGETYTAEVELSGESDLTALFGDVYIGWISGFCMLLTTGVGDYTVEVVRETATGDILCRWKTVDASGATVTLDIDWATGSNAADYAVLVDGVALGEDDCIALFNTLRGKIVLFDDGSSPQKYGYLVKVGGSYMIAFDYVGSVTTVTVGYIPSSED